MVRTSITAWSGVTRHDWRAGQYLILVLVNFSYVFNDWLEDIQSDVNLYGLMLLFSANFQVTMQMLLSQKCSNVCEKWFKSIYVLYIYIYINKTSCGLLN